MKKYLAVIVCITLIKKSRSIKSLIHQVFKCICYFKCHWWFKHDQDEGASR